MTETTAKQERILSTCDSGASSGQDIFYSAVDIGGDTSCDLGAMSSVEVLQQDDVFSTNPKVDLAEIDTELRSSILSNTSASSSESSVEPADGEYLQLLNSVELESPPLTQRVVAALKREPSQKDLKEVTWYGHPLSVADANDLVPSGDGGLVWQATIIPDEYVIHGKMKRGMNHRDFDPETRAIKPRRATLPLTASDFFASLTKINGPAQGQSRYIFHGMLNGWPGLRTLELISVERRRQSLSLPSPIELISGQIVWVKTWSADEEGRCGLDPSLQEPHRIYQVKLRGAPWSGAGWSKDSPGFCFWYESQGANGPRVSYGTNLLTEIANEPVCTSVHMISHRYAVAKGETPRDRLTYHSICLLEWDHRQYCTVIESAYLNGMGGYNGKTNWFADRDEPVTTLYQALPPEMICPWKSTRSEIRCYDVPAKSLEEFQKYMARYEGPSQRFVDPRFTFSHAARLTFRSKPQIAQYLINYIMRDSSYAELKRNCQTFAADLCSFLAGKKNVPPFHPVNRIDYQNRAYLFLYESQMYDKKKKGTKK